MQYRSLLIFGLAFLFCTAANAQDKIYKTDGDIIDAKVLSVDVRTITYLLFNNLTGPQYSVLKRTVDKIVYENGNTAAITPMRGPDKPTVAGTTNTFVTTRNILSVAPIQFTENGLGVGLMYERSLDRAGIIAFYLPIIATFNLNGSTYYNYASNSYQNTNQDAMFYAMPGIKIYPTGSAGTVKYALGPSIVIGEGQKSTVGTDPSTGLAASYVTQNHTVLGIILNNSLNLNPGNHIHIGFEFGFGFTYLNRLGGLNQGTQGLVQGGFCMGYRF